MSWLTWQNPVTLWWVFLVSVSVINISLWIWTRYFLRAQTSQHLMIALSGAYVFGCAFRSFLPRADVQRICLFDTWFSSVLVGRTVATIAELSFVAQWAIALGALAALTHSKPAARISKLVVPLIIFAECCSWYSVITTQYLGNTIEESTWGVVYSLLGAGLLFTLPRLTGPLKYAAMCAIFGCVLYVGFMFTVDVPMYFHRWQNDLAAQKPILGFTAGLQDLNSRWVVTHDIEQWRDEIPWQSLYFSAAVWTSLALCYLPLAKKKN